MAPCRRIIIVCADRQLALSVACMKVHRCRRPKTNTAHAALMGLGTSDTCKAGRSTSAIKSRCNFITFKKVASKLAEPNGCTKMIFGFFTLDQDHISCVLDSRRFRIRVNKKHAASSYLMEKYRILTHLKTDNPEFMY